MSPVHNEDSSEPFVTECIKGAIESILNESSFGNASVLILSSKFYQAGFYNRGTSNRVHEGPPVSVWDLYVLNKLGLKTRMKQGDSDLGEYIRRLLLAVHILYYLQSLRKTRRGRRGFHLRRDIFIIHILLVRAGLETNPGPRCWKDLPCDVPHLGILSSCIVHGWEYYGDRLGLTEADRDVIVAKYKRTQAQIYHMLKLAAQLPCNRNMRAMLTVLELCAHEYDDMCVDWIRLEDEFGANVEDEHGTLVSDDNDTDNGGQDGRNKGSKRKTAYGTGHTIVKMQRV